MEGFKYNPLELARILGEPVNPKKRLPDIVNEICEVDSADPNEYVYYYDVLAETETVYNITSAGSVTSANVTPDTPTAFTFVDLASPEYYVKLTDLASAKERVLARKMDTINRALNNYEIYYLITLMATACSSASHTEGLTSSATTFNFKNIINMIDDVKDYSDNYTLIAGSTVEKDLLLWDWTDNKYTSLAEAFAKLNISVRRITGSVTIDGSPTTILNAEKAYLVGTSTAMGKPLLFVRKKLNDIDLLGGAIKENGEKPERLVFVSPNPVQVSTTRYLAVGITGFEEIVAAVTNMYALSEFTRS